MCHSSMIPKLKREGEGWAQVMASQSDRLWGLYQKGVWKQGCVDLWDLLCYNTVTPFFISFLFLRFWETAFEAPVVPRWSRKGQWHSKAPTHRHHPFPCAQTTLISSGQTGGQILHPEVPVSDTRKNSRALNPWHFGAVSLTEWPNWILNSPSNPFLQLLPRYSPLFLANAVLWENYHLGFSSSIREDLNSDVMAV